jgi:hypothetical protein
LTRPLAFTLLYRTLVRTVHRHACRKPTVQSAAASDETGEWCRRCHGSHTARCPSRGRARVPARGAHRPAAPRARRKPTNTPHGAYQWKERGRLSLSSLARWPSNESSPAPQSHYLIYHTRLILSHRTLCGCSVNLLVRLRVRPERHRAQSCAIAPSGHPLLSGPAILSYLILSATLHDIHQIFTCHPAPSPSGHPLLSGPIYLSIRPRDIHHIHL